MSTTNNDDKSRVSDRDRYIAGVLRKRVVEKFAGGTLQEDIFIIASLLDMKPRALLCSLGLLDMIVGKMDDPKIQETLQKADALAAELLEHVVDLEPGSLLQMMLSSNRSGAADGDHMTDDERSMNDAFDYLANKQFKPTDDDDIDNSIQGLMDSIRNKILGSKQSDEEDNNHKDE